MRIGVPEDQNHLEEEHTRRPHNRCSAEPGKNEPGHHRLDLKQQERADKNRNSVSKHLKSQKRIGLGQLKSNRKF